MMTDHMMTDHMMQGMQYHMIFVWAVVSAFGVMIIAMLFYYARNAPTDNLLVSDLAAGRADPFVASLDGTSRHVGAHEASARDTLFILPDISHYTRFMTGNQFAFGHAQHIIFCLINAMIEAATKTVELSKLEGDAALFFVDAHRHSDTAIGETVMEIFRAFFRERRRLKDCNICPCRACRHVDDLDLKIFVHMGQAAHFKFRGSVDLFGTDVIILHRMMKNGVSGHRYVMVTDAAANCIRLPGNLEPCQVEEYVEHVGSVGASVFEIDDAIAADLSEPDAARSSSMVAETCRKLRENVRSIRTALSSTRQQA